MKKLLNEIISLLKNLNEYFIRENLGERVKDIQLQLEKRHGQYDEQYKRIKALEEHFGIEFHREYKYQKK